MRIMNLLLTLISIAAAGIAVYYTVLNTQRSARDANVAFVNFQTVLAQSNVGKSINEQLAPKQAALRAQAEAKVKALKAKQEELNKKRPTISAEEAAAQEQQIQREIMEWNVVAQQQEAALNKAVAPELEKIDGVLREELTKLAGEQNITAILPMQGAFFVNGKSDLTSEAIRRLDAKMSKVTVDFSKQ